MKSPDITIIIPVFNASASLAPLLTRLESSLNTCGVSFDVMMVDDGSTDDSWLRITNHCTQLPWLAGIRLTHNAGQNAATLIGMSHARGKVLITMDDDLQHPPESIPELLKALTPEVQLVYGAPDTLYRKRLQQYAAASIKWIMALCSGALFLRHMRSFRALRADIVAWSELRITPQSTIEGALAYCRPVVRVVNVAYASRFAGQSTYTPSRSLCLAWYIFKDVLGFGASNAVATVQVMETAGWLNTSATVKSRHIPPS